MHESAMQVTLACGCVTPGKDVVETSDEDGPATLVGYFRGFGRPASMDTGRQACSEVCSVFES